jgi:hypothetical protein
MRSNPCNPKRADEPAAGGGRTLLVAIVLFGMICGLLLVFAPHAQGPANPEATQRSRTRGHVLKAAAEVRRLASSARLAGQAVRDARYALESTDYGRTRAHLDRTREKIQLLVASLETAAAQLEAQAGQRPGKAP